MRRRDSGPSDDCAAQRRLAADRALRVAAVSFYSDELREMLEPTLACPSCRAMNSPTLRQIRVDVNGVTCCKNCGCGGAVELFQPRRPIEYDDHDRP